jgi:CRP-like cAMP-binding protein
MTLQVSRSPDEDAAKRADSFLSRLSPVDMADLVGRGHRRRWRKGETLCTQGEPSYWVAILLSGMVKATTPTDDGVEILLRVSGPGELIGELEVSDGKPRPATIVALEPTEALAVPQEHFSAFLESHDAAVRVLVDMLCERLRDAERRRYGLGAFNVTKRLAQQLVELADRYGQDVEEGVRISLALTQDELASWIGASRESVSKALRSWRQHGLIETGRRSVLVRDLAALRAHSELSG